MPLPFILGAAAIAGGLGASAKGLLKIKNAKDKINYVKNQQESILRSIENENIITSKGMDELINFEFEILKSFENFTQIVENIKNVPEFKIDLVDLEKNVNNLEELKDISRGADTFINELKNADIGVASGFAAIGTSAAVGMFLKDGFVHGAAIPMVFAKFNEIYLYRGISCRNNSINRFGCIYIRNRFISWGHCF